MPRLQPHDDPANEPHAARDATDESNRDPGFRFSRLYGPGASVALSIAVFMIVLAAGVSYDHAHRLRAQRSGGSDTLNGGAVMNGVHAPSPSLMAGFASGTSPVLLAQARDCVRAGQSNCVEESTHGTLALDRKAQSAPAMRALKTRNASAPTWIAPEPNHGAKADYRNGTMKAGTHAHSKRHFSHRLYASRSGRFIATETRRATPEVLADLYRH